MTKDNQTTVIYGDELAAWVEEYVETYETSKAAAFRYAVRQQVQRSDAE